MAQRSAEAAKEIKALIAASSAEVGVGVNLVRQTGASLQRIIDRVAGVDGARRRDRRTGEGTVGQPQ